MAAPKVFVVLAPKAFVVVAPNPPPVVVAPNKFGAVVTVPPPNTLGAVAAAPNAIEVVVTPKTPVVVVAAALKTFCVVLTPNMLDDVAGTPKAFEAAVLVEEEVGIAPNIFFVEVAVNTFWVPEAVEVVAELLNILGVLFTDGKTLSCKFDVIKDDEILDPSVDLEMPKAFCVAAEPKVKPVGAADCVDTVLTEGTSDAPNALTG